MAIEYDPGKSQRNRADLSRGFGFEIAADFEWESSVTFQDTRKDYGEDRFVSLGLIHARVHVMVWTRRGNGVRIISLRKANADERKRYEQEKRRI
jgi:uncharacterized DUF497 family protein